MIYLKTGLTACETSPLGQSPRPRRLVNRGAAPAPLGIFAQQTALECGVFPEYRREERERGRGRGEGRAAYSRCPGRGAARRVVASLLGGKRNRKAETGVEG